MSRERPLSLRQKAITLLVCAAGAWLITAGPVVALAALYLG